MQVLSTGVGRMLKSLVSPDYDRLRSNLTAAGAPKDLVNTVHGTLTSSKCKNLYGSFAHCFEGAGVSLRKLNLIYLLKVIMRCTMSR